MAVMRPLPLCLMASLLAACASAPQWEKAGSNDVALSEDLQRCRVGARLSPAPAVPMAQTSSAPMVDRGQERDAQEDQQIRQCMQGKGYSLKR